ncbi:unnamed protein product [Auanema sp. JU1783]|nr:unnamed protein product [Auanema sp. JU1783]
MHHEIPESLSNQGSPSPSNVQVRVSPTGSSKRKSRPVKRIICSEEESGGSSSMQMTSDGNTSEAPSLTADIKSEDMNADVAALVAKMVEEEEKPSIKTEDSPSIPEMEQAEMMRRLAEMFAAGAANSLPVTPTSPPSSTATLHSLLAAAGVSPPVSNGSPMEAVAASPAQVMATDHLTSEGFLQAILSSNMAHLVGNAATPASTTTNFSSLLSNSSSVSPAEPSTTPTNSSGQGLNNRGPVKRKLFENSRDMLQKAVTSISNEERKDMGDLENFAQVFKKQRIKFGFTQGDVGVALGRRYGTDFSQTTISRFEALNLSFKNMCKLRPLLKEWLSDAEKAIANGASLNDLLDKPGGQRQLQSDDDSNIMSSGTNREPYVKRRRKRTNLDLSQRTTLDACFAVNPRPDHERMTEIAGLLDLDRDVVRVWFCNRRQKMRRSDDPEGGDNNVLLNSLKALAQVKTEDGDTSAAPL